MHLHTRKTHNRDTHRQGLFSATDTRFVVEFTSCHCCWLHLCESVTVGNTNLG